MAKFPGRGGGDTGQRIFHSTLRLRGVLVDRLKCRRKKGAQEILNRARWGRLGKRKSLRAWHRFLGKGDSSGDGLLVDRSPYEG